MFRNLSLYTICSVFRVYYSLLPNENHRVSLDNTPSPFFAKAATSKGDHSTKVCLRLVQWFERRIKCNCLQMIDRGTQMLCDEKSLNGFLRPGY